MKNILQLTMLIILGIHNILCAQAPAEPTRSVILSNVTGNSVKIELQAGGGANRIILARKANEVNAIPENGKTYSAKTVFGSGALLNGQNYAVYSGSNLNVTITNLEPNTVYHFASFEFNNTSSPVYIQTATTASVQTKAGPTVPVTNAISADVEGNSLKIISNGGDGSRKLIILKKGNAPGAVPENGKLYRADRRFGSGFEIAPGEFVVHDSGDNTTPLTNLEPGSAYYFRIYSYDVDAAGYAYYLKGQYLAGQVNTVERPAHNSQVTLTDVTGSSATFLFNNLGGKNRIIVMRQNEPVTEQPTDLVRYAGGNKDFGKGSQLGAGNYIIAGSTNGNAFTVTNLKAGSVYYAQICDFNGYYAPVYHMPGEVVKVEIPIEPDKPASELGVQQVEGTSLRAFWKKGSGARRLVVARKDAPVSAMPADGQVYQANATFGEGHSLADGQFVVYDGEEQGFNFKGLEALSVYHLAIFEYNLPDDKPNYRTSSHLSGFVSTIPYPTVQTSDIALTKAELRSATINFQKGNGEKRMFVMRQESTPAVDPQDFIRVSPNSNFGSSEIGTGNFAVYAAGTGNEFTVGNLVPGITYVVHAYEYNGNLQPAYLRPAATFSFVMPGALPVTWLYFKGKKSAEGNALEWATSEETNSAYFVVERSLAPVLGFEELDTIQASGNSNQMRSYKYTDYVLNEATAYYRLKQVDQDGTYSYSRVVSIAAEKAPVTLYPNPVIDKLYLARNKGKTKINIYSLTGLLVKTARVISGEPVDVSGLNPGTYVVITEMDNIEFTHRIIKH
jgi:hypothetical protein